MIQIDRRMKIPPRGMRGRHRLYPWTQLQRGDSFFVKDRTVINFFPQVAKASKTHGMKYTIRAVDGGVRVWRIK